MVGDHFGVNEKWNSPHTLSKIPCKIAEHLVTKQQGVYGSCITENICIAVSRYW